MASWSHAFNDGTSFSRSEAFSRIIPAYSEIHNFHPAHMWMARTMIVKYKSCDCDWEFTLERNCSRLNRDTDDCAKIAIFLFQIFMEFSIFLGRQSLQLLFPGKIHPFNLIIELFENLWLVTMKITFRFLIISGSWFHERNVINWQAQLIHDENISRFNCK